MLPLFALMLFAGAFFLAAAAAAELPIAPLTVDDVWLTGDTLHIAVTDAANGKSSALELKLSDYAKSGDEYVTVQASDAAGRASNVIQFKNPYFVPAEQEGGDETASGGTDAAAEDEASVAAPAEGAKPFTPSGAASVVDDAEDSDGKEFFTMETADGNVFYLIVDRQRNAENVYFLSAVTESDLVSLAKVGDGKPPESVIPAPSAPAAEVPSDPPSEPASEPPAKSSSAGSVALVVIAVLASGGAGCYFKIVRPKKEAEGDGFEENGEDDMNYESAGGDERGADGR
jgi:hypothetical protein